MEAKRPPEVKPGGRKPGGRSLLLSRSPLLHVFRLQAHVADGIAPVAVAGAAADGTDLELVVPAGREAVDGHVARVGEQAAVLPGAGRAIGTDEGVAHFVALRVGDGADADDELAGHAVDDVLDRGCFQRGGGAVRAHGVKAAGEQRGEVVATVLLHIAGQLAQQADERLALVVLVRRLGGAALRGGGDGLAEGRERGGEVGLCHRRRGVGGIAVGFHVDGHGRLFQGVIGRRGEAEEDA